MPIIKLLVDGGSMKPGPTVGQQLGPLGINIGDVINKVNEATASFKGMKLPVVLDINSKTKAFSIEVFSPPTSELLKKELSIEKGSGDHKKESVANASIEQIINVAKIKHPNMLARDFKSAVKSVIGSCVSLGILIENLPAVEIEEKVQSGKYDIEINQQKSQTSPEKLKELKDYFTRISSEQAAAKKAEEEAKAAEEAKKAEAKTETTKEGVKEAVKEEATKEEKKE